MWLKDTRCNKVVSDAWSKGLILEALFPVVSCLESCRSRLDAWNQSEFRHVAKQISQLQKHLEWLELQPTSTDPIRSLRETRVELNCWLDKGDDMWKQWSRLNWF